MKTFNQYLTEADATLGPGLQTRTQDYDRGYTDSQDLIQWWQWLTKQNANDTFLMWIARRLKGTGYGVEDYGKHMQQQQQPHYGKHMQQQQQPHYGKHMQQQQQPH